MADRLIKIGTGGRAVVQGVSNQGAGQFEAVQARSDILTYRVEYTRWLEGDTIDTYTVATVGVTVVTVDSADALDLTVSSVNVEGSATLTVTTVDGRVKEIVINFLEARMDA